MAESTIKKALGHIQRFYVNEQFTISGNGFHEVIFDMSEELSYLPVGYFLSVEYVNCRNSVILTGNYWLEGETIHVIYKNTEPNEITTTAQASFLVFW